MREAVLTLWTADAALASRADAAGVDRVGVDLERHGKRERQAGMGSWISDHEESALPAVGAALSRAALFARCDPPHAGTGAQVERLLAAGVRVLMLPMYRTAVEVEAFVSAVAGRATVVLLLETPAAARLDPAVLSGVDEIHVGLNDLARACGLASRFALLASADLDRIADAVHGAGLPLGVGGVARPGDTALPVPPDLVYARLAGLGATSMLLSRSFAATDDALDDAVQAARACHERWLAAPPERRAAALTDLRRRAATLREWP